MLLIYCHLVKHLCVYFFVINIEKVHLFPDALQSSFRTELSYISTYKSMWFFGHESQINIICQLHVLCVYSRNELENISETLKSLICQFHQELRCQFPCRTYRSASKPSQCCWACWWQLWQWHDPYSWCRPSRLITNSQLSSLPPRPPFLSSAQLSPVRL